MAILVVLWRDLFSIAKESIFGGPRRKTLWMILLATIPAAVVGLTLEGPISGLFESPRLVAILLMVTGLILLGAEWRVRFSRDRGGPADQLDAITIRRSVGIGVAQALAILPGISRSGTTISAGMVLGLDRETSARFSFLLIVPILLGASVLAIPQLDLAVFDAQVLAAGFLASFVSSYFAISLLLSYLKTRTLTPFGWYCLGAGSLSLAALSFIQ
jgi:undecaprenyl-diphosphatase